MPAAENPKPSGLVLISEVEEEEEETALLDFVPEVPLPSRGRARRRCGRARRRSAMLPFLLLPPRPANFSSLRTEEQVWVSDGTNANAADDPEDMVAVASRRGKKKKK